MTNDNVVKNARAVAVRFASGEVAHADVVGLAPNYDLAVLRLRNSKGLPPPVVIGSSIGTIRPPNGASSLTA